jgi:hypothetical protein
MLYPQAGYLLPNGFLLLGNSLVGIVMNWRSRPVERFCITVEISLSVINLIEDFLSFQLIKLLPANGHSLP